MSRVLLLMVAAALVVACGNPSHRILILARGTFPDSDLTISKELKPIVAMVKQAGYTAEIASADKASFGTGSNLVTPDLTFAEVKVHDYAGVILPCLRGEKVIPAAVVTLVNEAVDGGLAVAAQKSGEDVLLQAGVLAHRAWSTSWGTVNDHPGVVRGKAKVVTDGKVTTSPASPYMAASSGDEDGTIPMMEAFLKTLRS